MRWQDVFKTNFRKVSPLLDFLEWDAPKRALVENDASFPLNLPIRLAQKAKKNSLEDPIIQQFIPFHKEKESRLQLFDVLDESAFRKAPRLLHKYPGRVLFTASHCAMHCRYCFRRDFPYEKGRVEYEEELSYIQKDSSIQEVILSGGDPLSLSDPVLANLLSSLDRITHLKRLRFHTRFPIGIPERICSSFLDILTKSRLKIWFVVHINHLVELDQEVEEALNHILALKIPILTQTVLLKGVNDSLPVLQELFLGLVDRGFIPYYLHQTDNVPGTNHMHVPVEKGLTLLKQLEESLPGYAVPHYVQEIPGRLSKTRLHSF